VDLICYKKYQKIQTNTEVLGNWQWRRSSSNKGKFVLILIAVEADINFDVRKISSQLI